jgi:hypothetical protein
MTAYEKGRRAGLASERKDRTRMYESDKAEKAYWNGYIDGMKLANVGKYIVQCEREGKIFATADVNDCYCPTCGRRYINGESDRKITVIAKA